ncbi:hypothetical protein BBJ28_00005525 [Nothophytophthora sp. Chile5]|nr:hypothetical protein BBJ28_00005525 [Nothophytophthora sp. Chile5]
MHHLQLGALNVAIDDDWMIDVLVTSVSVDPTFALLKSVILLGGENVDSPEKVMGSRITVTDWIVVVLLNSEHDTQEEETGA